MKNTILLFLISCSLWFSSCNRQDNIAPEIYYPPLDTTLNTHVIGHVKKFNGLPLANARILLLKEVYSPSYLVSTLQSFTTDANGYYQFAFDANLGSGNYYYVRAEHDDFRSYTPSNQITKDTLNTKDFWVCENSYLKLRFRNSTLIDSDRYTYIIQMPSGCFANLMGRQYASSMGASASSSTPQPTTTILTNSGGYSKITINYFLQGAQVRTLVDSLFMNPADTSHYWLEY